MNLYCNNCGNKGHIYRNCKFPVLSYGIICINNDDGNDNDNDNDDNHR